MKITEGYMPYGDYRTYYRIVGEKSEKPDLLLLHGGPGSTHNYMELFDELAKSGRRIISYDQLGCGNSFIDGKPELWTADTWLNELTALIRYLGLTDFHLLGQSWGGMLAIKYLCDTKPVEPVSVILSSTLPCSALWGYEQHRMIKFLSENEQAAIQKAEANNDYTDSEYLAANEHYMQLHCSGPFSEADPECLRRPKRSGTESYLTAWGPNEYTPLGTLSDFDYTDKLGGISIPALIISGTNDLCTPLIAKTMYDRIPNARWELFQDARHMCYADQHKKYMKLMMEWMQS